MATIPQGTIQLTVNGSNFGQPIAVNPDGTYSATTTLFPSGTDTVTAVYSSSNGLDSSTSDPVVLIINVPDLNTATSLAITPNPANQGDLVTVSGAVTSV